jgi:hypothetical protein
MADLNWKVGDIVSNARGAKSATTLCTGECRKKKFRTVAHPLQSPYGASSFDPNSSRLSIEFHVGGDIRELWEKLDKWTKDTIDRGRAPGSLNDFLHKTRLTSCMCVPAKSMRKMAFSMPIRANPNFTKTN